MHPSLPFLILSAISGVASAIDLTKYDPGTRISFCNQNLAQCTSMMLGYGTVAAVNDCDYKTMTFHCIGANGMQITGTDGGLIVPFELCTWTQRECVVGCNANPSCVAQCNTVNCATPGPSPVSAPGSASNGQSTTGGTGTNGTATFGNKTSVDFQSGAEIFSGIPSPAILSALIGIAVARFYDHV